MNQKYEVHFFPFKDLYLGIRYDLMHQVSNDSEVTRLLLLKLLEMD